MAEEKKDMGPAEGVDTSSLDSSRPPPGNQEAMAENIHQSQVEANEELTHTKTSQSEVEPVYPNLRKLVPTVIALYLAFFLVALVCHLPPSTPLHSQV